MASVPVIAPVCIAGPVASEAHEDKLAVIVGPEEAERVTWAPRVTDRTTTIRPGNPVEYPARRVIVTMVMVKTYARIRLVTVAAGLSVDAAAICSRTRR
jgi:hypothetical protein